jgi:hypothetical protein
MSNPSPICTVNGAAPPADVAAGSTVNIALAVTAGANYWTIACIGCDEQNTVSALNATITINSGAKTATITAPAALGSAFIVRSTVGIIGLGLDANGIQQPALVTTFKVNVKATNGLRVMALNETTEQSSISGWGSVVNAAARGAAGGGGSTVDGQYNTTLANGLNSNIATTALAYVTVGGPTAAFSVGGFNASPSPSGGQRLRLKNTTAFAMSVVHQDASSTAANRIDAGAQGFTGTSVSIPAGSICDFVYNGSTSRWDYQQTSVQAYKFSQLATLSPAAGGQIISVDGYSSQSDGGQGQFFWNATDTRAADGGTIVQVTTPLTATGRWNRSFTGNTFSVRWFGATGTSDGLGGGTDDGAAIQACVNAVVAFGGGTVFVPQGFYRVSTAITIPVTSCVNVLGDSKNSSSFDYASTTANFKCLTVVCTGSRVEKLSFRAMATCANTVVFGLVMQDAIYNVLADLFCASNCGVSGGVNNVRHIYIVNTNAGLVPQRGQITLRDTIVTNLGGVVGYNAGDSRGIWLDGTVSPITAPRFEGNVQVEECFYNWRLDYCDQGSFQHAGQASGARGCILYMNNSQNNLFAGWKLYTQQGTGVTDLQGGEAVGQTTITITAATNASPIVCTLATALPDYLINVSPLAGTVRMGTVKNCAGNTAANGAALDYTVIDSTHVSLNGTTGNGAYTANSGTLTLGAMNVGQAGTCVENYFNLQIVCISGNPRKTVTTAFTYPHRNKWVGTQTDNPTSDYELLGFDAKSYGALGNNTSITGTGGDEVFINAAIVDAVAAGGGRVRLREGTYALLGSIVMQNGVTLAGDGDGTVILAPASGITAITGADGLTNAAIENIGITCNGTGHGIHLSAVATVCANWRIDNVKITNIGTASAGIWLDCQSTFGISHVKMRGITTYGLASGTATQYGVRLGGAGTGRILHLTGSHWDQQILANGVYATYLVNSSVDSIYQANMQRSGSGVGITLFTGALNNRFTSLNWVLGSTDKGFVVSDGTSDTNLFVGNFGASASSFFSDSGVRTMWDGFNTATGSNRPTLDSTYLGPPVLTIAASGTTTVSQAQAAYPLIFGGTTTLTANITIDYGGIQTPYAPKWIDLSGLTLGAFTVSIKNGSTTVAVTTLLATSRLLALSMANINGLSVK